MQSSMCSDPVRHDRLMLRFKAIQIRYCNGIISSGHKSWISTNYILHFYSKRALVTANPSLTSLVDLVYIHRTPNSTGGNSWIWDAMYITDRDKKKMYRYPFPSYRSANTSMLGL
jgi:hypothetical protein